MASENKKKPIIHVISALDQNPAELAAGMNLGCDAVIVNQCGKDSREEIKVGGHEVIVMNSGERGVGKSRNQGLLLAEGDIILFGDEDIVYNDGYAEAVISEFKANPGADGILFNVEQSEGRETYKNTDRGRVRLYNCGRYAAYSIAVRRERLLDVNVWFSLLFGGGARYLAGEDSLFLTECLKKGMKLYRSPVCLGREKARKSTWFSGYNDRFFRDRGRLYRALYGRLAPVLALLYLIKNRGEWLKEKSFGEAHRLIREGMA